MLHTPGSTGTILSPDRYMKDTPDVHEFRHNGSMDSKGKISFHDIHGTTLSEIDMQRRRDGLWSTTNPVLKPPMPLTRAISALAKSPDEQPTDAIPNSKQPTDEIPNSKHTPATCP